MSNQRWRFHNFFEDFLENINIKEDSLNISYGLTELLSSFCSNTGNSESWEKVDCAGSCARHTKWKYQKIILSISIQYYFEII